jgi:hypothetical protein
MRKMALLASIAASLSAASAEPGGDAGERRVNGWLKTFATAPAPAPAPFEAPDYHASLIEKAAREMMKGRLEARGYVPAGAAAADLLTFSVAVDAPKPQGAKPLPKSPVQIASEDRNPFDNIYDPELRPEIVFDDFEKPDPAAPEMSVTIYARRGDARVWSGYAGARLGGARLGDASREAIAQGLVAALIDHFGDSVDLGATEFIIPVDAAAAIEFR